MARAAGLAVAELHDAGVAHPDLNLSNIVVAGDTASIVDLDRARVAAGGLAPPARRRGLERLARSVRKLDPRGEVVDAKVRRAFHDAYGRGPACGS
jgi:tRNA A-37 threonylcarbamoyl transferase component Bud32